MHYQPPALPRTRIMFSSFWSSKSINKQKRLFNFHWDTFVWSLLMDILRKSVDNKAKKKKRLNQEEVRKSFGDQVNCMFFCAVIVARTNQNVVCPRKDKNFHFVARLVSSLMRLTTLTRKSFEYSQTTTQLRNFSSVEFAKIRFAEYFENKRENVYNEIKCFLSAGKWSCAAFWPKQSKIKLCQNISGHLKTVKRLHEWLLKLRNNFRSHSRFYIHTLWLIEGSDGSSAWDKMKNKQKLNRWSPTFHEIFCSCHPSIRNPTQVSIKLASSLVIIFFAIEFQENNWNTGRHANNYEHEIVSFGFVYLRLDELGKAMKFWFWHRRLHFGLSRLKF